MVRAHTVASIAVGLGFAGLVPAARAAVEVCATSGGEPLPTAVLRFVDEAPERRLVDANTACASVDVLYGANGTEIPLDKGATAELWVVAPGYRPVQVELAPARRRSRVDVALVRLDPPAPDASDAELATFSALERWVDAAEAVRAQPGQQQLSAYGHARRTVSELALNWLEVAQATGAPVDRAEAVCRTAVDALIRCE